MADPLLKSRLQCDFSKWVGPMLADEVFIMATLSITPSPRSGDRRSVPRILIVDSDPAALVEFQRVMSTLQSEWAVDTAANGEEALCLMAERPYAALITALHMPGMGGIALLAQVSMRHPETRRLVHSSQLETVNAAGIRFVSHYVLDKPAGTMAILKMTKWLVEQRQAAHERAGAGAECA